MNKPFDIRTMSRDLKIDGSTVDTVLLSHLLSHLVLKGWDISGPFYTIEGDSADPAAIWYYHMERFGHHLTATGLTQQSALGRVLDLCASHAQGL